MLVEFIIFIVFVLLLGTIYWYWTVPNNLPPGPFNYPFIGYSFRRLETDFYLKLNKWANKYGPICSFYAGNQLIISITDYDLCKEAFVKQADTFTGKQHSWIVKKLEFDNGLLLNDGPKWKEQRRFALATLRDFGFGKPILENGIFEELQYVCHEIRNAHGRPYDLQYLLNNAVSNVICQLVFGRRFSYDDEEFQLILRSIFAQSTGSVSNAMVVRPWMMNMPWIRDKINNAIDHIDKIKKFVEKFISLERSHFDASKEPENYIQSFLKAQHENAGEFFTDLQLQMSVHALFTAGTETTSTTVRWGLLLCTIYPEIQKKLQEELDNVVGPPTEDNMPMLQHRKDLPYCEAVLLEIQRYASLVPTNHRYMHEETKLMSYHVPKNALILRNNWSIHHNPKYFPEPSQFRPERFIDEEGKIQRPETFVPFGLGKRICLGESLAKMELFLFFAFLMHKFNFSFPPNTTIPSLEPIGGITLKPCNHELIVTERFT